MTGVSPKEDETPKVGKNNQSIEQPKDKAPILALYDGFDSLAGRRICRDHTLLTI